MPSSLAVGEARQLLCWRPRMTFHEVASESLFRMLELFQLDRRGAAGAVAQELRFVAEEAERERNAEVAAAAWRGMAAAEQWATGVDIAAARVEVVKVIAWLFRELDLEIR